MIDQTLLIPTLKGCAGNRAETIADIVALAGGGGGSLADLSDVTLTAPATGSVLFKTAGNWVNTDLIQVISDGEGVVLFDEQFAQVRAMSLSTQTAGINIMGGFAGGDTSLGFFDFEQVGFFANLNASATRARWTSFANSVPFEVRGKTAALTFVTNLEIHPDNGVILRFLGIDEAVTKSGGFRVINELEIDGDLNHDGANAGFYATTPIAQQTGVAVSDAAIHAALVNLGLITA